MARRGFRHTFQAPFPPFSSCGIVAIECWELGGRGQSAVRVVFGGPMGRRGVRAGVGQIARIGAVVAFSLALAHCGKSNIDPKYGVAASPRVVDPGEAVPKGGGRYSVGKPYVVAGRTYVPEENNGYSAEGLASWYGDDFHGRLTANREIFDMRSLTAAHPTLPLPSYVRVTNLSNRRSLIVRVNDRGPYHGNRLIDVSVRAAKLLDFHERGVTKVRVDYVGRAALEGSDDTKLAATLRHGSDAPAPSPVMVASAKKFLPEFFDPNPIVRPTAPASVERPAEPRYQTASAGVAVPAPAPRAATVARAPIAPPQVTAQPARTPAAEPAVSFESRFAPAMQMPVTWSRTEPLSAFAPARSDNIMTGRGLY